MEEKEVLKEVRTNVAKHESVSPPYVNKASDKFMDKVRKFSDYLNARTVDTQLNGLSVGDVELIVGARGANPDIVPENPTREDKVVIAREFNEIFEVGIDPAAIECYSEGNVTVTMIYANLDL